jgi:hypothetical protein
MEMEMEMGEVAKSPMGQERQVVLVQGALAMGQRRVKKQEGEQEKLAMGGQTQGLRHPTLPSRLHKFIHLLLTPIPTPKSAILFQTSPSYIRNIRKPNQMWMWIWTTLRTIHLDLALAVPQEEMGWDMEEGQ